MDNLEQTGVFMTKNHYSIYLSNVIGLLGEEDSKVSCTIQKSLITDKGEVLSVELTYQGEEHKNEIFSTIFTILNGEKNYSFVSNAHNNLLLEQYNNFAMTTNNILKCGNFERTTIIPTGLGGIVELSNAFKGEELIPRWESGLSTEEFQLRTIQDGRVSSVYVSFEEMKKLAEHLNEVIPFLENLRQDLDL